MTCNVKDMEDAITEPPDVCFDTLSGAKLGGVVAKVGEEAG